VNPKQTLAFLVEVFAILGNLSTIVEGFVAVVKIIFQYALTPKSLSRGRTMRQPQFSGPPPRQRLGCQCIQKNSPCPSQNIVIPVVPETTEQV
jgi:hypothetical protein